MWIKTKALRARLPLAIALLLAWWLACWLATGVWFNHEAQYSYNIESQRAKLFVGEASISFNRVIKSRQGGPRVLARDVTIQHVLTRFAATGQLPQTNEAERRASWSADPELAHINSELKLAASEMGLDVLWLLDANGYCLAASNAESAKSIVGTYYGDHEDFRTARLGRPGYQVNVDKKMGTTGLAYSAPVIAQGRFIGVVSGGNALTPFASLLDQAHGILSDHNGVVMLSHDPSFMLQTLPGSQVNRLDAAARQVLYQRTEFKPLNLTPAEDDRFPELVHVPGQEAPALLRSQSVADGGLSVNVLWPMPLLAELKLERVLSASALGTIGTLLMLLAAVYASRRREQRTTALALAQREQQATQARNFLDQIVNAIADPLFVKDREHRWVLVNQAFCKIHSQPRENFIGKSAHDAFPERIAQGIWDADERVLTAGIEIVAEEKLTDSQGVTHIVVTKKAPYTDAAGQCFIVGTISERKQVERLLRTRQREFRNLAENNPDVIIRYDRECRRIYANSSLVTMAGREAEELVGRLPVDHTPLTDPVRYMAELRRVMESGAPSSFDVLVRRANGEAGWYEIRMVAEFDEAGQLVGVLTVARDVTERKAMEETLALREQEYRSLAENLPDNVTRWDVDGRYLYINSVHERTLGVSKNDMIGKAIPDSHSFVKAAIAQVVATGQAAMLVRQSVVVDGETQIHDVSLAPEHDAEGHVVSVLGVGRDMTDIYRMQEAIAARDAEFRTLVEQAPEPIFRYAPDGRRIYVNAAVERISGMPASVLLGGPSSDGAIASAQDNAAVVALVQRIFETGEPGEIEVENVGTDGRLRHFHNRLAPEFGADGKVRSVFSICHDITERKAVEDVLRESRESLNEAQRIAHVGSWDVDMVNDKLIWSDEIYRIWEIDPAHFKADFAAFIETVHPQDRENVNRAFRESLINHSLYEVEHRLLFPDGRVKYILERGEPQYDAQGNPVRFIGTSQDITSRRRMEDELQRGRLALEDAQRIGQIGSWELDLVSGVLDWSDETCRMFEIDPAVFGAGMDAFMNVIHPEDRERVSAAYDASIKNRTAYDVEHRLLLPNGRIKDVRERGETWYDADGRPLRTLGTVQNITEAKLAEARLRKSRDIVRALAAHQETEHEKERRKLAYDIHEDLAQNLAALRLNISLFEMSAESIPGAHLLKTISAIADRSIVRIRDIVSVLRPTVLDLGLVPALHWLTDDFKGFGFQFDLALPEDILLNDEVSTFLFRAAREALLNVALHAAATHIHVSLNTVAGVCRLAVRDNGCGFDPAAPQREGSFGLIGLTEQARYLGGDLSIDSTPDQGTALEIRVPGLTGDILP